MTNNTNNTNNNIAKIKCKYCGGSHINNNGKVNNGNQRYLCRDCRKTFTITKRKYSNNKKMKVIKMVLEGIGIRSIERLEKIPNTTILKWIKSFGKTIKEKMMEKINQLPDDIKKEDIEILEGDEIVTYIKKNSKTADKTSRYGFLLTDSEIKLLIFK